MKFSLIIPAKDEEKRILLPLLEYYHALYKEFGPKQFEIIVVINNTTDNTKEVIKWLSTRIETTEIKIINAKAIKGKGAAIIEGFKKAKGDIVGFIDADGSSSQKELTKLYSILSNDQYASAAIASRYMEGGHVIGGRPIHRIIASKILHKLIHILYGAEFFDFFCGLKLFKKRTIQTIIKDTKVMGWAFDVNIILALLKSGFIIKEVPTEWEDRTDSKVNIIKYGFRVLKDLFQLKKIYRTSVKNFPRYSGISK